MNPNPIITYIHNGGCSITLTVIALALVGCISKYSRHSCHTSLYFYILLIGLMAMLSEMGMNRLTEQQSVFNSQYRHVKDAGECPQFVEYLSTFQSTFNTYPFGLAVAGSSGLMVLLFLLLIKNLSPTSISNSAIYIICFVNTIITFAWVYKILNCILGRMCGEDSCTSQYFHNP